MATLAQAKREFELGMIKSFQIERVMGKVCVHLTYTSGDLESLVDARTKSLREFKTFDAAVSAVEQIGFKVSSLKA